MKKLSIFIICLCLISFNSNLIAQELTKEERSKAINHLKNSQKELFKTVKGLSEKQLNYKSSEDAWSIAECMEHIAISEKNIFGIVQMTLKNDPDPTMRAELKMSDEQVVSLISSRERKVKTRPEFEPSSSFGSYEGSIEAFKSQRKSNLGYVKSTTDDLRNRFFDFPFGKTDSYQVILFLSGHTVRHTDQIKEVMKDASFPDA